jgi:Putative zinc-finger
MSDRNDPRSGPAGTHPDDEALADYVDGTAPDEQRRLVEAHLETCATCRADVDLARSSLTATVGMREADAPGLDPAAIGRIAQTSRTVVPITSRRRSTTWLGVAGGLAAASIAGLLAFGLLRTPGGGGAASTAAGPEHAAAPSPGAGAAPQPSRLVPHLGGVYTSDETFTKGSIDALASSTVASSNGAVTFLDGPSGPSIGSGANLPKAEVAAARACAKGIAALSPPPLYMLRARFEGQPAYVSVFVSGQRTVRVVVTTTTGCTLLYQSLYQSSGPSPSG